MKRISPNSLINKDMAGSRVMPMLPAKIPTKRIHVTPSDTPAIFILDRAMPIAMVVAIKMTL